MILGQAVYQLAITFMLYFAGDKLLDAHLSSEPDLRAKQLATVVFNTFVWMQIFNEFNNRRLDNKFNIFEGMLRNYWFLGINAIMIGGQIMIVFVGGQAFNVTRLSGTLWGVCIICSIACLPWAIALRLIPDYHFGIVFNAVVGGMAVVLRPLSKGFKIIGHGIRSFFRPVKRFTRRVINKGKSEDEVKLNPQPTESIDPEQASREP
jgi:Cation transport ATPase